MLAYDVVHTFAESYSEIGRLKLPRETYADSISAILKSSSYPDLSPLRLNPSHLLAPSQSNLFNPRSTERELNGIRTTRPSRIHGRGPDQDRVSLYMGVHVRDCGCVERDYSRLVQDMH